MVARGTKKPVERDDSWFTPALEKQFRQDLAKGPIRPLTEEERVIFSGAAIAAARILPSFRDAIALLNPYMDATCETAYVDRYARMAVGYWFIHALTPTQRGSVLLHETMHVMNSHFTRGDMLHLDEDTSNVAGDLEINTTLESAEGFDLAMALYPDQAPFNFPAGKTLEQYAHLLGKFGPGNPDDKPKGSGAPQAAPPGTGGEPSDSEGEGEGDSEGEGEGKEGSGKGKPKQGKPPSSTGAPTEGSGEGEGEGTPQPEGDWGCGPATEERSEAADKAGIEKASAAAQGVAKANTEARIVEALNNSRSRGDSAGGRLLKVLLERLETPKVRWQDILRRVISNHSEKVTRGRADYSYRRISRRHGDSPYIFPGMIKYEPSVAFGIDTSGSMSKGDYARVLAEVQEIIKMAMRGKTPLRVFSVDTVVSKIKPVTRVEDINLKGGGGTDMSVAFRYINELPKREKPDLFILATDGGTDWLSVGRRLEESQKAYQAIILVTQKNVRVADKVQKLAKVLHIAEA